MVVLLKRKPVLLLGSLFAVSLIFAMMPNADAAGVIEGEFKLGEV